MIQKYYLIKKNSLYATATDAENHGLDTHCLSKNLLFMYVCDR